MTVEAWRPISGFPGYEVSDLGRVRSWRTKSRRNPRRAEPLVMKLDASDPYLMITMIAEDGRPKRKLVHHLVLEAFVCARPPGAQCCHGPGGRRDNSLGNLRWGTSRENADDKIERGEAAHGERNGSAKLTEEAVRLARAAGMSVRDVMVRWRIGESAARAMLSGQTWRRVSP